MKRKIFFILMLFFIFAPLLSAGEIPLEKAIESGIQKDPQYQNRLLDSKIAALNRQKARLKKLFNLNFNSSYLFKSQQMEIVLPDSQPAPGVVIPGMQMTAGSKHNYDLKLSLTQPIFTGNILSNSAKLEMQKETVTRNNAFLREIEITGLIKLSYFTYQLLENKRKSLSLLIENLELHLKKITDFYKEELVKKSDVLETEIKISEAKMNLENLSQLMKEEKINFKKLCGFNIEEIERGYRETVGTLQDSLSFFKTGHPALKTMDENIRMQLLKKKIISGNYLPQVSGFAELHYGKPGIDFFANEWSLYFQGGIAVNFKIFDWNQLKEDKKIVDFSIQQLDNRKEELVLEIKKSLDQLYSKKESIERQLEIVKNLVKYAAEDAGLKEELYKENQVSNIDFLSALLTKERYKSMQNELMLQSQLVKLNINRLIGR